MYTGEPQNIEKYDEVLVDDIKVYILKDAFSSANVIKLALDSKLALDGRRKAQTLRIGMIL